MAARVGLRRDDVIATAVELLIERGSVEAVTLGALAARLGVRTQSIYAHVNGLDDLRREFALQGLAQMAAVLGDAAMGRAGSDAIEAIVFAYLDFAADNPGLYAASVHPPGDDPELLAAIEKTIAPLNRAFRSYGLDDETRMHWYRVVFATISGFSSFRRHGQLAFFPNDPDDTVRHMIRIFTNQLALDAQ